MLKLTTLLLMSMTKAKHNCTFLSLILFREPFSSFVVTFYPFSTITSPRRDPAPFTAENTGGSRCPAAKGTGATLFFTQPIYARRCRMQPVAGRCGANDHEGELVLNTYCGTRCPAAKGTGAAQFCTHCSSLNRFTQGNVGCNL